MNIASFIFYFFAGLSIFSGLFILFTKNVLYAVLALLVVFLGVSVMYIFAGADFLAVTQLVVYVGGVIVLMLFGVMLTNREGTKFLIISSSVKNTISGIVVFLILFSTMFYTIIRIDFSGINKIENSSTPESTTSIIGKSLMSDYIIAFELAGLLLLVALIGAVYIAGKKERSVSEK